MELISKFKMMFKLCKFECEFHGVLAPQKRILRTIKIRNALCDCDTNNPHHTAQKQNLIL